MAEKAAAVKQNYGHETKLNKKKKKEQSLWTQAGILFLSAK